MKNAMIAAIAALSITTSSIAAGAASAEPVTFKDSRITIIVGYPTGGGADLTARLVAPLMSKYLPGNPTIVVQNMPGAEGVKALNHFAKQVKPDGLTLYVGSANEFDPVRSRSSAAQYDLSKLSFVGGNVRFQSVTLINKAAKNRLLDKSSSPVMMGSPGYPRSGSQTVAWGVEYLGWNVKWVTGYRGTTEIILASERGEIDMRSDSSNKDAILSQIRSGKFEVATLGGRVPSGVIVAPEYAGAPQIVEQIAGKIQDPVAKAAFDYWMTMLSIDKWLALPPDTSPEIVAAHRDALLKVSGDPDFKKGAEFLELILTDHRGFENAVNILDQTPQAAVDFMAGILRKQGLDVAQ